MTFPKQWSDAAYLQKVEAAASAIRDYGRMLLATEVHSVQTYWRVGETKQQIYASFNQTVVGIMWSHMAQFQTWFGNAVYEVHGIQQMPYTPVSEWLLQKQWVPR